ncbi:MAG: gamma-glutamyl-gamma-aminobutyrate hydrolase family protein [Fimbriiglobus sp.]
MARNAPPRPLIGINCDYYTPKMGGPFAKVNTGYFDSVLLAEGLPIMLPPVSKENYAELDSLLDNVSAMIMVGGMDLDPRKYGQPTSNATQIMAARREESDRYLLSKIVERKMPLLAIGSGMQLLNVFFGGTLYQHLPLEYPRAMPHYDQGGGVHRHMVNVEKNTTLEEIFGTWELRVNSSHHQAINQMGKKLRVSAKAPDGVIEAIETTDESWFCIGTQWHPECDSASALDRQIFGCLIEQAHKYAESEMAVA